MTGSQGATQYILAMRRGCNLIVIEASVFFFLGKESCYRPEASLYPLLSGSVLVFFSENEFTKKKNRKRCHGFDDEWT